MPPIVQNLEEILAELETAYAPVRNIYNQSAAAIPAKYDIRRTALEGSKNKNFDAIAGQAGRAGMSWGGFTQNEQADYLADKFLPGMQQSFLDQDEEGRGIAKSLAQLDLEKRMAGMSKRSDQEKVLQSFQENERQRAFQAEQAKIERESRSREAAISRGGQGTDRVQGIIDTVAGGFSNNAGPDGKVSPETYIKAKNQALAMGMKPEQFDNYFRRFVNESHAWQYGYGTQPGSTPKYGKLTNVTY